MRILKTSSALTSALITSLLAAVPQIALAAEGDGIIDPGEDEIAELAKATQNPISSLISLPLQNNTDFNFGPNNETRNVLNVQPVWPISLNDDWNLINPDHSAGDLPAWTLSGSEPRDRPRGHGLYGIFLAQ